MDFIRLQDKNRRLRDKNRRLREENDDLVEKARDAEFLRARLRDVQAHNETLKKLTRSLTASVENLSEAARRGRESSPVRTQDLQTCGDSLVQTRRNKSHRRLSPSPPLECDRRSAAKRRKTPASRNSSRSRGQTGRKAQQCVACGHFDPHRNIRRHFRTLHSSTYKGSLWVLTSERLRSLPMTHRPSKKRAKKWRGVNWEWMGYDSSDETEGHDGGDRRHSRPPIEKFHCEGLEVDAEIKMELVD